MQNTLHIFKLLMHLLSDLQNETEFHAMLVIFRAKQIP